MGVKPTPPKNVWPWVCIKRYNPCPRKNWLGMFAFFTAHADSFAFTSVFTQIRLKSVNLIMKYLGNSVSLLSTVGGFISLQCLDIVYVIQVSMCETFNQCFSFVLICQFLFGFWRSKLILYVQVVLKQSFSASNMSSILLRIIGEIFAIDFDVQYRCVPPGCWFLSPLYSLYDYCNRMSEIIQYFEILVYP